LEGGDGGRVLSDHPPLPLDSEAITFCCTFIDVADRNRDKQETKVTMKNIMAMTERETLKVTVGLLLFPKQTSTLGKNGCAKYCLSSLTA